MSDEADDGVLERQKRREIRGSILRTTHRVYGQGGNATFISLVHVAGIYVTGNERQKHRQVREQVTYLIEKEYLREVMEKRDAKDLDPPAVYQLTAKGMDLINGDIEDAAIEL